MIDMYDLPTEAELAQAIMESAKKNDTTGEIDEKRIFPFWSPTGGKNVVKLSDKTGVVTPKVDFTQTETRMDKVWEDFLAAERARIRRTPSQSPKSMHLVALYYLHSHRNQILTNSLVQSRH